MRVDDATDLREFAVKQGVGIEIARRAQAAFDDVAFEIGNDQVRGGEGRVVDAAGLDDHKRLRRRERSIPLALPKVCGARPRRAIS